MQLGDFSKLAKAYNNRPGYSSLVLSYLKNQIGMDSEDIVVADIGAGTGKLTENLYQLGLSGIAIEPNDAMRVEGINTFEGINAFQWKEGSAENTGLESSSVDWVLMGSSFHWTNNDAALKEFNRILKPGGFFTVIYNPRNIEISDFHMKIEQNIKAIVPELKRNSSGHKSNVKNYEEILIESKYFENFIFMEAPHQVEMSRERYIGAWQSVNDIQVQAGKTRFGDIISMIENETQDMEFITVPYKTRAWTVQKIK